MLGEGGFGCVYLGNQCTDNPKGVSKIMNYSDATHEIELGIRVRKIPHYKDYFVPIESSCVIQSTKLACKPLRKDSKYMVLTMPFIKTVSTDIDRTTFVKLMTHVSKLIKAKIVHFDLKKENILFTPEPLIIDFGISIDMRNMYKDLSKKFYTFSPRQYEWPIEAHFLCYRMYHSFTPEAIEYVCEEVYSNNPFLENLDECIEYYSFLSKYSDMDAVRRLLHGWKTWDVYALTIMLFKHDKVDALRPNLHYNPKKRLSLHASRLAASRLA
jgi:serine/threonine protein kinase